MWSAGSATQPTLVSALPRLVDREDADDLEGALGGGQVGAGGVDGAHLEAVATGLQPVGPGRFARFEGGELDLRLLRSCCRLFLPRAFRRQRNQPALEAGGRVAGAEPEADLRPVLRRLD